MTLREKFFRAMRREAEGYLPFDFSLCPALADEFERRYGAVDTRETFGVPVRPLEPRCISTPDKFLPYFPVPKDVRIDPDWGVGRQTGGFAHFERMVAPMAGFRSLADFEAYPYPDPATDYDWPSFCESVAQVQARDRIAVGMLQMTIFEMAWYLRGMERFLVDLVDNPELAGYHLDRITAARIESARRYAQARCDVLSLGDDVSTQRAMMIRPTAWRRLIKPRLAEVIQAAKTVHPGILICYHGDGNLQAIIPELIEIGVEILNPVQPECMDPVEIKRTYGDRLSFWGTIGTQTTMPFGRPQEVREVCRKMIREVGRGGGLLLAPSHVLEPEVPWENVEAFMDVVQRYNNIGQLPG